MFGKRFFTSIPGRIATTTASLAVLGAAAVALYGQGPQTDVIIVASTLACILGSFLTVGFAANDHWREALTLILALPVLGIYFVVMNALDSAGSRVGTVLLVISLLPLTETLFARAPATAPSEMREQAHA